MKFAMTTIKSKLFMVVFSILILSLTLTAILTYLFVKGVLRQQIITNDKEYFSKISQQLSNYITNVVDYSKNIIINEEVQSYIVKNGTLDGYDYFNSIYKLENVLRKYVILQDSQINDIYIMNRNYDVLSNRGVFLDLPNQSWFADVISGKGREPFSRPHPAASNSSRVISYVSNIYDMNRGRGDPIGKLIVDLKFEVIQQILGIRGESLESIFLYNGNGELLLSNGKTEDAGIEREAAALLGAKTPQVTDQDRYYYFVEPVENSRWSMVGVVSHQTIFKHLNYIIYIFMAIVLICIIVMSVMIFPVINSIVRPLAKLARGMKEVAMGKLEMEIDIRSGDEIEYLANIFKGMVKDIKRHVQELVLKEKKDQEIQLRLLMAQINPHFIYNTLNSIIYMARAVGATDIILFTKAFIRILQATIQSKPNMMNSLREEIEYIDSYVLILKYRYNQMVALKWDVDETLLDHFIPKMLIYPLVENSIFHGIFPKAQSGEVTIGIRRDHHLVKVEIADNGIGMSKEKLEELTATMRNNEAGEVTDHIGVQNVHSRLRLLFTEDLNIESEQGSGTKVWFYMPLQTENQPSHDALLP